MFDPKEMAIGSDEELIARVSDNAIYQGRFQAAFGDATITPERIGQALVAFQSTVVSGDSPFDHWLAGDPAAMSESQKRGFVLFNGKAQCASCHTSWRFTDDSFHDIGLVTEDLGRGEVLGLAFLNHAFKTPGLRDIARRAPYMHNGSVDTLEAAVRHYEDGFVQRDSLSQEMKPFTLTDRERADLVAFLNALNSGEDSGVMQAGQVQ
jgi:cytochrome c peroxidase